MKNCNEMYEHCERKWFDRYYRFRERYYTNGNTPDEYQRMHLDYLHSQYEKFHKLASANT